jgi:ribonuclease J
MTTPKDELLFLALGGSDEIGMNVNLYGCQGKWVMIDLGITFANAEYPGVDIVLPDLEFIEDRRKDLLGIVLTHGHEDHIGAVRYMAAELGVPLYATPFTAALINDKLEEEGVADQIEVNIIPMGGSFSLGPFDFRMVTLAHSILEMSAVLINTPYGRIFHTGDWKLDEEPVIGAPTTAEALTAIGDEGVLAMVCDSTNAFNPEDSGSEGGVKADLIKSVNAARQRVLVTTFASNAARLQTLGEVALATNRRVCVAGRSLNRIIGAAQATGYLKNFPQTVDMNDIDAFKPHEVMIIATGGQGEERAALARIADGTHPIKLAEGDTVIFSSKQIPGNEVQIGRVMNNLARLNVRTVTEKQAHVHVSGHPGRPELSAMYKWIRPQMLIPVHGERRHMAEQAHFALSEGVPQSIVQSNGDVIRVAPDGPVKIGVERTGRLVVDGDIIIPADGVTMNERRKISLNGVISAAVALSGGRLFGKPDLRIQGVPVDEEDRAEFYDDCRDAIDGVIAMPFATEDKLREALRLAVRRVATEWTGKKPVIDILLIRSK